MKKKLTSIAVSALMVLAGCGGSGGGKTKVEIIFAAESNQGTITYNQINPITLPNEQVIRRGDLKPMWQEVASDLDIKIVDKTNPSQTATQMWGVESASKFKNADIYGGPNLAENIMAAGANRDLFIDLTEHLDKMPDLNAFLTDNPIVKKAITAHNGGIYHIPYIAEIGNYARVLNGRYSWVEIILDGTAGDNEVAFETVDTTRTLPINYTGYWVDNLLHRSTNVIKLQNQAAVSGNLSQSNAVSVLRNYIDSLDLNLDKRSDFFLGPTATYDFDELVALWRCIKLSPTTLTKQASGTVKSNPKVIPYFTRQSSHREEYLRLLNFMGGKRVHGGDAYGARFYLDKDGELQYSYAEDSFLDRLIHLKNIFAEGLVDSEIVAAPNTDNLRSTYYFKDQDPLNNEFGFMTFDYISSTTAEGSDLGVQRDVISMLPPMTTTPVSNGQFIHFIENTRSIKGDGWGITTRASGDTLEAALKLFNFFFTEKGSQLQNYGSDYLLKAGTTWTRPDGTPTDFPEFIPWVQQTATEKMNGNVSDFLRFYMGSLMPIGYQKIIGFEHQTTSLNGFKSWDLYDGVAGNTPVLTCSLSTNEPFYRLVTPTISITKSQQTQLDDIPFSLKSNDIVNSLFAYIEGTRTIESIKQNFSEWEADRYVAVYRTAYNRANA